MSVCATVLHNFTNRLSEPTPVFAAGLRRVCGGFSEPKPVFAAGFTLIAKYYWSCVYVEPVSPYKYKIVLNWHYPPWFILIVAHGFSRRFELLQSSYLMVI